MSMLVLHRSVLCIYISAHRISLAALKMCVVSRFRRARKIAISNGFSTQFIILRILFECLVFFPNDDGVPIVSFSLVGRFHTLPNVWKEKQQHEKKERTNVLTNSPEIRMHVCIYFRWLIHFSDYIYIINGTNILYTHLNTVLYMLMFLLAFIF